MKNIILIAFLLFTSSLLAQVREHKEEPSRKITNNSSKIEKVSSMFIYPMEEMNLLFIDNKIPADFPGYNHAVSRDENVVSIKKWMNLNNNKALLTADGSSKIAELISSTK